MEGLPARDAAAGVDALRAPSPLAAAVEAILYYNHAMYRYTILFILDYILAYSMTFYYINHFLRAPSPLAAAVEAIHPIRNPRFVSFRTQPLENLSATVKLPIGKRFLGNPILGTNLG